MTEKILKTELFIIGGGINGMGIAADASGRGLSVCLCEKEDLGSHTSSASSKLIHGGLRYLETFEFRLVRESLQERAKLLKMAPHIVHPIEFIIPLKKNKDNKNNKTIRAPWRIRLGLLLYNLLAGNVKSFANIKTLTYTDCTVDDARLVILNALRAKEKGALILPRTQFISAHREKDYWVITLENRLTLEPIIVHAQTIINTAGAFVDNILQALHIPSDYAATLVKGSHIVVPKLYEDNQAYLLQHPDNRVVFVIPFEKNYTMIGTTDIEFTGNPDHIEISESEIKYLCEIVNQYFPYQVQPKQVVYSWSGVRVLANQKKSRSNPIPLRSLSREYKIEINASDDNILPIITVFGGKITTYRALAEKVLTLLAPYFKSKKINVPWTANDPLPGGDIPDGDLKKYKMQLTTQNPWLVDLPVDLLERYVTHYGSYTENLLQSCHSIADLGRDLGHGLYAREVDYLCEHEWAITAEDILWRRTKLGLVFSEAQTNGLEQYLHAKQAYFATVHL